MDSSNDVRRRRRLQGVMGNLQHGGGGSRFVLDPKTVELKQDTVYIPPPTNDNEKEEEEMTLHHPLLHLHHQQLQQAQQLLHQQQQQLAQLQLNSSVSPPGLTNVNEQQQQQSQLLPQPLEQPPLQPQLDHQPQQQQQQQQFVQKPEEISQQVQNNNVNNFATPNEVQQQQQSQQQSQQQLIEQQSLQQQFNEPQQQQQQQFIPPEIMQQEQPMIQNQNDDINNINLANNHPRNNEVLQQQSQQQQLLLDQQQQASPEQQQQQEFVVHQTRQEIVPSSQQQQQQQQQLLVQQPHIQQEPIQDNLNNNFLVIPNNNIVQSNHLVPQELNPQLPQSVEPVVPSSSTEKLETVANSLIITPPPTTIQPYNIYNILETLKAFRYQGFFFIYDSTTNEFVIIHATPTCDLGCVRIYRIASILAYALRKNFPERFPLSSSPSDQVNDVATFGSGGGSGGRTASNNNNNNSNGDLVFVISTGDVPRIHHYCLSPSTNYCSSTNFGPILQFGSIFVNSDYMPSMIAMPQPVRPHMPCFDEWQLHGRVCNDLQPAQVTPTVGGDPRGNSGGEEFRGIASFAGGLVFGQELGLISKPTYWNDLIPQIIWRGTDFVFLHTMFPKMRRPNFARDIAPKESITRNGGENKRWAIDALWGMGEMLQPRWRGVLLTSEAELEADEFREGGDFTLPWVNIKFASCNVKRKKVDASQNPEFVKMESVGIKAIGERVNMQEQAKYRYHIDLGGGKDVYICCCWFFLFSCNIWHELINMVSSFFTLSLIDPQVVEHHGLVQLRSWHSQECCSIMSLQPKIGSTIVSSLGYIIFLLTPT